MKLTACTVLASLGAFGIFAAPAAAGVVLITQEEAKLPPQRGAVAAATRGITRGPRIEIDGVKGLVRSPMRLQLKFVSFGGAAIDLNALQMTYLRNPNVDLTPRVRPFALATGIDMADVELPPGEHPLRVEIKDSEGRSGSASFTLKVEP